MVKSNDCASAKKRDRLKELIKEGIWLDPDPKEVRVQRKLPQRSAKALSEYRERCCFSDGGTQHLHAMKEPSRKDLDAGLWTKPRMVLPFLNSERDGEAVPEDQGW